MDGASAALFLFSSAIKGENTKTKRRGAAEKRAAENVQLLFLFSSHDTQAPCNMSV